MTTTPLTSRSPVDTTPVATLLADRGALARTLDDFAAAFTTLSSLLVSAPAAPVLDRVRDAELLREWPLPGHPDCRRGTALLAESATAREQESLVRRDYNRLFRGPERMKAPPYESVHRSKEHLVFEQETMQVRAAYAEFGLTAPRLGAEPDDHIGLELSFVATLAVHGMDAMEAGDDLELARVLRALVAFLDEHLLAWAPRCLAQAADGSTTLFYQGVAALGLGTLELARATFLP
jgi:putative dimethyl sulfoxide reductase chaperone